MGACFFGGLEVISVNKKSSRGEQGRERAWTTYWRSGALHSCPTSFHGNYQGAIAEFWKGASASLPVPARVLDVGTGNGSIPRLLIDAGVAPDHLDIDAVDAADISPAWHSPADMPNIRFHPGVPMESLPFAQASFDAVCSQFAIEYASAPVAWEEALRVLRPAGHLYWVMHHRESIFAQVAMQECEHLDWLSQPNGLLDAALALAPWLMRLRRGDASVASSPHANEARARFNLSQQEVESRIRDATATDILGEVRAQVHAILARSPDPESALGRHRAWLGESRLRSAELVSCALDAGSIQELCVWLKARMPRASISVQALQQAEGVLAWGLVMRNYQAGA
jgi:SAM-dependent methyltransferase